MNIELLGASQAFNFYIHYWPMGGRCSGLNQVRGFTAPGLADWEGRGNLGFFCSIN